MTSPNLPRRWWCAAAVGVAAAALLPVAGRLARRIPQHRCALDGAAVDPAIKVEMLMSLENNRLQFCSLFCAERWLQASGAHPRAILVTDEATGESISAESAHYVRSLVIAHEPTGERRHVFGSRQGAQRHADEHYGRVLEGRDRPFGAWLN